MPVIIKKPGAKPASPAPRKAGTKAPAKKTTTRKTTAKPTTTKAAGKTVAKNKPAAKSTAKKTTTRAKTPANPRGPVGKQLSAAGAKKAASLKKRHEDITEKKDDLVNEIFEFVKDQRGEGVSLQAISDELEMSRQWLYKMGDHQGRGGKVVGQRGGGTAGTQRKSTAKKPAAKTSAAKKTTTTRKPAAKASAAKKTTTRTTRKPAAKRGIVIKKS